MLVVVFVFSIVFFQLLSQNQHNGVLMMHISTLDFILRTLSQYANTAESTNTRKNNEDDETNNDKVHKETGDVFKGI